MVNEILEQSMHLVGPFTRLVSRNVGRFGPKAILDRMSGSTAGRSPFFARKTLDDVAQLRLPETDKAATITLDAYRVPLNGRSFPLTKTNFKEMY
jgi:hypothetical protein